MDETRQQENPSAHRSFHTEEHAPGKGSGRKVSRQEKNPPPGTVAESDSRRGEEYAKESDEEGRRETGRRGRSQRPSGTKDAEAFTGVDPQDPSGQPRNG
ncbi:hypothetical protein [Streptomyces sp. NPDC051219]|uniref:hypothetical protein n=1 Tax=Streptomyces sp. NPDC051219 TaxID=3155283 RepID=UPI003432B989